MQQFVVPQFLDVEDKVIGPITVRQFIILLAAGGMEFVAWKWTDFSLFIAETIFNGIFTILFAFIKINGRPVHYFLLNFIQTTKRPWLSIWNKEFLRGEFFSKKDAHETKRTVTVIKPHLGTSRLAELSLVVDTGGIYEGETRGNQKK